MDERYGLSNLFIFMTFFRELPHQASCQYVYGLAILFIFATFLREHPPQASKPQELSILFIFTTFLRELPPQASKPQEPSLAKRGGSFSTPTEGTTPHARWVLDF